MKTIKNMKNILILTLLSIMTLEAQESRLILLIENNTFKINPTYDIKSGNFYEPKNGRIYTTANNGLYMFCLNGIVYYSNNVLKTYEFKSFGPKVNTNYTIHVVNENVFYANDYNEIYKTIDGGKNWTLIFNKHYVKEKSNIRETSVNIYNISFSDTKNGIIYCTVEVFEQKNNEEKFTYKQINKIYTTHDGGMTWIESNLFTDENIKNKYNIPVQLGLYNDIGYITFSNGDIFKTNDHANTWNYVGNLKTIKWDFKLISNGYLIDNTTLNNYIFIKR